MAKKIHGLVPQIPTTNTSAPSIISATTCHGVGKAHKAGATKKYSTVPLHGALGAGQGPRLGPRAAGRQVLREQHGARALPRRGTGRG